MRSFVTAVPLSIVAVAIAVAAAAILAPRAAAIVGTRLSIAYLLLLTTGLVLAATIVPDADALAGIRSDGTCDLSRLGLASINELTSVTTSSLNVLLFVPLGISIAWLPMARWTALILATAFSLTFVVEGIQMTVTELGRGCQSADVVDNLLGLVVGLSVGLAARWLVGASRSRWQGR